MSKYILVLLHFLFIPIAIYAQGDALKAKKVHDIIVDGKDTDWPQPFSLFDNKTNLIYAIANDQDNIYICLKSPDEWNQLRILQAGMTITISDKGKPKMNASINYPISEKNDKKTKAINPTTNHNVGLIRNNFMILPNKLELNGFLQTNGTFLSDSSAIKAAISTDSLNILIYEAQIPIKELMTDNYARELTLTVVVSGLEKSKPVGDESEPTMGNEISEGINGDNRDQFRGQQGYYQSSPLSSSPSIDIAVKSVLKQKFVLNRP